VSYLSELGLQVMRPKTCSGRAELPLHMHGEGPLDLAAGLVCINL